MKISSLFLVLFLSVIFFTVSAESPYSLEDLREYDKLRVRINRYTECDKLRYNKPVNNKKNNTFLRINGVDIFSQDAKKIFNENKNVNTLSFAKYENKLLNSILKSKSPLAPNIETSISEMNKSQRYEAYLSQTVRVKPKYSYSTIKGIPLIMNGKDLNLNLSNIFENIPKFAVKARGYLQSYIKTDKIIRSLLIAETFSLLLVATSLTGMVVSIGDDDTQSYFIKGAIASGISGIITIPFLIRFGSLRFTVFIRSLCIYDRELRDYYEIDELQ